MTNKKHNTDDLTNLDELTIKLHDNRKLLQLASLVGTDAKTPELNLAKYISDLITTECNKARIDELENMLKDFDDYESANGELDIQTTLKQYIAKLNKEAK